jgi:ubiquitin-conjugating enzyme (huntingtin interacting protein 2)
VTLRGPPDTPYEGGTFELFIQIPDIYPFKMPRAKFITKIYHPNVREEDGLVCFFENQWTPADSIIQLIMNVYLLLD